MSAAGKEVDVLGWVWQSALNPLWSDVLACPALELLLLLCYEICVCPLVMSLLLPQGIPVSPASLPDFLPSLLCPVPPLPFRTPDLKKLSTAQDRGQ